MEVLACAESAEAVIAAVQSGADAVYIRFGGRGVTESALAKSVRYCRVRGCRVYAELDALVTDAETSAAAALAKRASELGVDALIAQDLGFVTIARGRARAAGLCRRAARAAQRRGHRGPAPARREPGVPPQGAEP